MIVSIFMYEYEFQCYPSSRCRVRPLSPPTLMLPSYSIKGRLSLCHPKPVHLNNQNFILCYTFNPIKSMWSTVNPLNWIKCRSISNLTIKFSSLVNLLTFLFKLRNHSRITIYTLDFVAF